MQTAHLLLLILVLTPVAYSLALMRSRAVAQPLGGIRNLKALPFYYAARAALWCAIPALIVLAVWAAFEGKVIQGMVIASMPAEVIPESAGRASLILSQISNVATGKLNADNVPAHIAAAASVLEALQDRSGNFKAVLVVLIAVLGAAFAWTRVVPHINARENVERTLRWIFFLCAAVAVLTTAGIVFSVIFETLRFFERVPITDFLFSTTWSPQTALRIDQIGSEGAFGVIPLFTGTLLISAIALLVAVPTGLLSAVYLSEYASKRARSVIKPLMEMLAGVPTVVYGSHGGTLHSRSG